MKKWLLILFLVAQSETAFPVLEVCPRLARETSEDTETPHTRRRTIRQLKTDVERIMRERQYEGKANLARSEAAAKYLSEIDGITASRRNRLIRDALARCK